MGLCKPQTVPNELDNNGILSDVQNGGKTVVCENNVDQSPSMCDNDGLEERSLEHPTAIIQNLNGQKRNRLFEMSRLANLVSQPSFSPKLRRKQYRQGMEMNSRSIYTLDDKTFASSLNVAGGDLDKIAYLDTTDIGFTAASSNDTTSNLPTRSLKRSASLDDVTFIANPSNNVGK